MSKNNKNKLTSAEQRLIETLLQENSIRDADIICKKAKISKSTYNRCIKKDLFQEILRKRNLDRINQDALDIIKVFREKALEGSFNHGKAMLELAGYYKSKGHEKKEEEEEIVLISHIPRPQPDKNTDKKN